MTVLLVIPRVLRMIDYAGFFKDDPWVEIVEPLYPLGRQLYQEDDRFWVSRSQANQIQFFVHEKEVIEIEDIDNLAGVEISINPFNQRSSRLICTLTSDESINKDKFSIVAKDVAFYCSRFKGEKLFLKVQERIKSWANFLKPTQTGLLHSELVGFWGELYTVSEILMKWIPAPDLVRFWVGPDGKKQDITLNSLAIEVKTSVSGDPRTINISSLEQLDSVTPSLYLLHIIANPSEQDHGVSLRMLYLNCIRVLSQDASAKTLFLHKVSGLYGRATDAQLDECFSVASLSLYDVKEGFPMLTSSEVANGIAGAQYQIYTSAIDQFDVTSDFEDIIKNG